jgi:hypothetical protein
VRWSYHQNSPHGYYAIAVSKPFCLWCYSLWHVIEHILHLRATFLVNYDVFLNPFRGSCSRYRFAKLSRPWTVSRSAATAEERIDCAGQKRITCGVFSRPDFERNVLNKTAVLSSAITSTQCYSIDWDGPSTTVFNCKTTNV